MTGVGRRIGVAGRPRLTTSKSSSGRQEFESNTRMIRPSCPRTAVAKVWVTVPFTFWCLTPKSEATPSTCAGVPVASVH